MMAFAALFVSCANDSSEDKEEKEGIEGFYTYTTVENGTKKTYFMHIYEPISPEEELYNKENDSIEVADKEKKFDLNSEFLLPGIDVETKLFRSSKLLEYLKTQEAAGNGTLIKEDWSVKNHPDSPETPPFYFPGWMVLNELQDYTCSDYLYSYTVPETGITYYFTLDGVIFNYFFTQERYCTDEEIYNVFKIVCWSYGIKTCEADLEVMRKCKILPLSDRPSWLYS